MKTYEQFVIDRNSAKLNEGIFDWAGKLIKGALGTKKVKKAIQKYETELPQTKVKRILKEFEIQLAKKSNTDTTQLDQQLSNLKKEENIIEKELDLAIQEVTKKNPSMSIKAERLKLESEKKMLNKLNEILDQYTKGKVKVKDEEGNETEVDYSKLAQQKIKEINKREQELETKSSQILKGKENKDKEKIVFEVGQKRKYTNKSGEEVNVTIKEISKDGKEVVKVEDEKGNSFNPFTEKIGDIIKEEK